MTGPISALRLGGPPPPRATPPQVVEFVRTAARGKPELWSYYGLEHISTLAIHAIHGSITQPVGAKSGDSFTWHVATCALNPPKTCKSFGHDQLKNATKPPRARAIPLSSSDNTDTCSTDSPHACGRARTRTSPTMKTRRIRAPYFLVAIIPEPARFSGPHISPPSRAGRCRDRKAALHGLPHGLPRGLR